MWWYCAILYFLRCSSADSNYNETIEYYERLITESISNAMNYQLPDSAESYAPKNPSDKKVKDYGVYDYIIVGAGSAGCAIANRLSAIKKWKILLVEAGGPENDFTDIPHMNSYNEQSDYNWGFNTIPQTTSCLGNINGSCAYPRGRGFGGTSILNSLIYSRGVPADYDRWEELGNAGWSFKDVLPRFIKMEHYTFPADERLHGFHGPLRIEHHYPNNIQTSAFISGSSDIGIPFSQNANDGNSTSAAYIELTTRHGKRGSSARTFLDPVLNRTNLKIVKYAYVTKVLIHRKTKSAYGIKFALENRMYRARACKEVILSAGVIMSPQILMLSGIGPEKHLKSLGIKVKQNLSVGEKLYDHPTYYGLLFLTNYTEPALTLREYIEQYLDGIGAYTIPANYQAISFLKLNAPYSVNDSNIPDIELLIWASNDTIPINARNMLYTQETTRALTSDPQSTFQIKLIHLHPKSVGSIKLRSKNPYDYPLIDSRYLSDPDNHDIEAMYEAIKVVFKLIETRPFKEIDTRFINVTLRACDGLEYLSRDYWYCYLRQLTVNVYHPMGTCKMGPNPQEGAVVDNRLKVHGIKNLRIADASIFPTTISGHPNGPCSMIGNVLSDLIINDNQNLN